MTPNAMHPDAETLRRFALGRLPSEAMETLERHLRDCVICGRLVEHVPGDRLVALLRRSPEARGGRGAASRSLVERACRLPAGHAEEFGREATRAPRASALNRRRLGWLLGLLGLSLAAWAVSGCGPSGVGSVDFAADPDEKTIGAPPKPSATTRRAPARPATQKKAAEILIR
jgi:hypothetical protein